MKRIISVIICAVMMIMVGVGVMGAPAMAAGSCGGVNTSIIKCDEGEEGAIDYLLITVVHILSGLIGILAVGGIIFSGYQYMMSSGDPTAMAKAKKRIINIAYGLIAYALVWGLLNFLIPGGLFT